MAWNLKIRWGYRVGSVPPVDEQFDTKEDGLTRAAEVLAEGCTVSTPGAHYHYPAAAIRFVSLIEDAE